MDGKPAQVDTANAYVAMQAKAKQQGINLRVVSGFRTMAEEQHLYSCYVNCNCNSCNLAAHPGTSNHQSGHALDLNTSDPGVYNWLTNHAHEFGFARTVPSEIWHWEWWGSASGFAGPCGGPPIPAHCASGRYQGNFCDDDGDGDEQSHDRLKDSSASTSTAATSAATRRTAAARTPRAAADRDVGEPGFAKVDVDELGLGEVDVGEPGAAEVGVVELGLGEVDVGEPGLAEVDVVERGLGEVDVGEGRGRPGLVLDSLARHVLGPRSARPTPTSGATGVRQHSLPWHGG